MFRRKSKITARLSIRGDENKDFLFSLNLFMIVLKNKLFLIFIFLKMKILLTNFNLL